MNYYSLFRIAKVLLAISIFLAIFNYNWIVIVAFLIVSSLMVLLYLGVSLILLKKYNYKIKAGDNDHQLIADIIGLEHQHSHTEETYLIFDTHNIAVYETRNVASLLAPNNNKLVINLSKPIAETYELETLGVSPNDIIVKTTQIILRLKKRPMGLIIIKVKSNLVQKRGNIDHNIKI